MDLMKVGVRGRLHKYRGFKTKSVGAPVRGTSQKSAGTTKKTFLWGQYSCRGSLTPWWETGGLKGLFLSPGFPSVVCTHPLQDLGQPWTVTGSGMANVC